MQHLIQAAKDRDFIDTLRYAFKRNDTGLFSITFAVLSSGCVLPSTFNTLQRNDERVIARCVPEIKNDKINLYSIDFK
jgi:hypothetical protein